MPERTHVESFGALRAMIPESWQDAEIAIGNSIGRAYAIRRVALHEDADGRRVIVLCEDVLEFRRPKKPEPPAEAVKTKDPVIAEPERPPKAKRFAAGNR